MYTIKLTVLFACSFLSFAALAEEVTPSIALPALGSMNKYHGYSALTGYTAPDGREYAILGLYEGTSIVDITDAPNLREVIMIPAGQSSPWTEMKTYKNYAYVVKDQVGTGIQVIDLSGLPEKAILVNTVMDSPRNHTVTVDAARGLLYASGGDNMNASIYSLEDPAHPKKVKEFNSSYVHDLSIHGNRAYLSEIMSKSFSIYDMTDYLNPKLVKRVRDGAAPSISFHNSDSTADGQLLLTTEESKGRPMRIWDMRDENNPVAIGSYIGPGEIPHNVHVKGNFAHIAHYGGGYRVVDISNPAAPVEVAFFNNRAQTVPGMTHIWEVYPYFASGKVIASSMQDGLLVTKFQQP